MPKANENKLLGIEILRFVSAFAVLVWHYQHFAYTGTRLVAFDSALQPFYAVLKPFFDYGAYGVQVFWCISGFIFFWKYREAISQKEIGSGTFFLLRFSRLYPLHFITLLLVALLQFMQWKQTGSYFVYEVNDGFHFVLNVFLASQWGFQAGYSFNGPIWSISIEVLVYAFFFALLRQVGKSVFLNLAVIFGCVVAKAAGLNFSGLLECIAFFYLGGVTAIFCKAFPSLSSKPLAIFLSIGTMGIALFGVDVLGLENARGIPLALLFVCTPGLLFCATANIKMGSKMQATIETLGNTTYSSYLLHFPLQLGIVMLFRWAEVPVPFHSPAFFLAFMGGTFGLSILVFRGFELPLQRWIRMRFLGAEKASRPVPLG
ncbi:MAG: acyltransferase [Pseudomonadota bacterium]